MILLIFLHYVHHRIVSYVIDVAAEPRRHDISITDVDMIHPWLISF